MSQPLLLVVGSINYDLIFTHRCLPRAGETVVGADLFESCGGKGANQAIAAIRSARGHFDLGVSLAGCIGNDAFGAKQRAVLEADGVDLEHLQVIDGIHTGTSSIWVEEESGQNRILNSPGANLELRPEAVEGLPIEEAAMILLQNEILPETLRAVTAGARPAGTPILWDPAPFTGGPPPIGPEGLLFVTPNEVEAGALLGGEIDLRDPLAAVRALLALGYQGVLLTLGPGGVAVGHAGDLWVEPAVEVSAVDTTAAGDAFNGAFAAALVSGLRVREAVKRAVAYAAQSVTRRGAQDSLP